MIVIEIAGGIILAVLILALLSWILVGLSFAFGAAVLLAIIGGVVWAVWFVPEVLVAALIIGGVFLAFFVPWLIYEKKARRDEAEQIFRDCDRTGEDIQEISGPDIFEERGGHDPHGGRLS